MKINDDLFWYSKWKPYQHIFFRGFTSNVYALNQGNEIWLFDCGVKVANKHKIVMKEMKKDGLEPEKISKIFLTHAHSDHMNALDFFINEFHPEVYIHEGDVDRLKGGIDFFLQDQKYWLDKYGMDKSVRLGPDSIVELLQNYAMGKIPEITPDVILKDGDVVHGETYDVKLIHTPGHTEGHSCYYIPKIKGLILGDLFDPLLADKPPLNFFNTDWDDFKTSIEKLRNLDIEILMPMHDKQYYTSISETKKHIENAYNWLSEIRNKVINYLKNNPDVGARISDFKPYFSGENFDPLDYKTFSFGVLKSLEKQNLVEFKDGKIYLIQPK